MTNELIKAEGLRVWSVDFSLKRSSSGPYRSNRTVSVVAKNIKQAIRGAQLLLEEKYSDIEEYWIVNANHRGNVHGVVVPE